MIRIREITENEQNLFDDLQGLIGQLTERPASRERLAEMIADPHVILLVAEAEGRRIGILTLALYDTLTARRGWVEDVVVDAAFRGCGAGRALVEAAVRRSAELGIDTLSLTSAPRRTAAGTLYRSEGFREAETTLFRLWTENSNVKI